MGISNAEIIRAPFAVSATPSPGLLERKTLLCLECPKLHQESNYYERETTEIIQGFAPQNKKGTQLKLECCGKMGKGLFS